MLTASLSHFSDYRVSIKQPEDPAVWKLKANRGDVGLFRGEVNYSYPLAMPRMADGLQPNLTLGYSSAAADLGAGDTLGLPEGTHSSFGKGWGDGHAARHAALCGDKGHLPAAVFARLSAYDGDCARVRSQHHPDGGEGIYVARLHHRRGGAEQAGVYAELWRAHL
ncbi:MAG: hypothetical protein HC853_06395 [Anaerolineae bacterium]|nr:hypothetical protein [Anaerolineae bacterium]